MIRKPMDADEVHSCWEKLSSPLDAKDISWRIDSKPKARDGKFFARFVCYVEAGTVRERLDSVVPGEWDLTLELLPSVVTHEGSETAMALKGRLQVLGVIREDVGQGPDYKQAATDAFKRAAVRFGIGHELYAMEQNWVEVDGDGKFAKPVEDPQVAYERRYGGGVLRTRTFTVDEAKERVKGNGTPSAAPSSFDPDQPSCPKCGGRMWDNRLTKRNPKMPDFKCRQRTCDGVIWPKREGTQQTDVLAEIPPRPDGNEDYNPYEDDIPF